MKSDSSEKLRDRYAEGLGKNLQCGQADVLFAALHVRYVTTVNAHCICHHYLRPAAFFTKLAEPEAKSRSDVCVRHLTIINCRL